MRPIKKRKLVAGFASVAGAAVLALGSLTAGAFAAPDPGPTPTHPGIGEGETFTDGPQTANVPIVAWVGEQVRLVACDPSIFAEGTLFYGDENANYSVEEWTGDQFQKPEADGSNATNTFDGIFSPESSAFFFPTDPSHAYDGCVQADYKSVKPGLARIKLNVYARNLETNKLELVYAKQFLVIWLTANKPTISEAGTEAKGSEVFQTQLNSEGQGNLASFLGDPEGNGIFKPSAPYQEEDTDRGLIQVKVTGSFPVEDPDMEAYLGGSSFELPSAWPHLATKLAESSETASDVAELPYAKGVVSKDHEANLWDIHGTPGRVNGPEETAVDSLGDPELICTSGNGSIGFSATDNCNGSTTGDPETTAFSRLFGDLTSGFTSTEGPYDPLAPNQTLLSDGALNENDAPMPALQIDVGIAENENNGTDLGGVGSLEEITKAQVYSHDFTGNAYEDHNLYNPYYGAWIPATSRPVSEASGVDGVEGIFGGKRGGDFTGFLNNPYEPYRFWTNVETTSSSVSRETDCLFRTYGDVPATDPSEGDFYRTPGGTTGETFYTDEEGELYLAYNPGDGFFFENLPNVQHSSDNECDLQKLLGKELGHSAITAQPVYPYQGVSFSIEPSETLTKEVISGWSKTLVDFPKSTEEGVDSDTRIFLAQAKNIEGLGIEGEIICFNAQGAGEVAAFTGTIEGTDINLSGSRSVPTPPGVGVGDVCVETDENGNAAIEVTSTLPGPVDVGANFYNEGVKRDDLVEFATAPLTEHVGETGKVPNEKVVEEPTGPSDNKTPSSPTSSPSTTGSTGSSSGGSSSGSGTSSPATTPGPTALAAPKGSAARVSSARLVKKGKHYYLLAKISAPTKNVKIKLVLLSKTGKVLHTINAIVSSNKAITLAVPYSGKVASVKLSVL